MEEAAAKSTRVSYGPDMIKRKPSNQVDVQTVPIDKVLDLWDESRMYEIKQTSSRLIQVYETLLPLNQILCCPQQAGYQ